MKEVYLDYAAATPLDRRVKRAMEPYWTEEYGNPSSIHGRGKKAHAAVAEARRLIAHILGCASDEIIFTSGATEADNLAVRGVMGARSQVKGDARGHIVVSKIEHEAILRIAEALEKEGHEITYLAVDEHGIAAPAAVTSALRPDTAFVSIGYANHEIGTIQPIAEISKVVRAHRKERSPFPVFHIDGSHAAGFLTLDIRKLGVDLMTLSSGKVYGPKGVGCLFVRRGTPLEPLIWGGGQERGVRSGTENVPGIIGFAAALELAEKKRTAESGRLIKLRDYFIAHLRSVFPEAALNGHPTMRLPQNINISIPGVDGEAVVIYLDAQGIRAATGSACASLNTRQSHVIEALGKNAEYTKGSLRFTLGKATTKKDVDYTIMVLKKIFMVIKRV